MRERRVKRRVKRKVFMKSRVREGGETLPFETAHANKQGETGSGWRLCFVCVFIGGGTTDGKVFPLKYGSMDSSREIFRDTFHSLLLPR